MNDADDTLTRPLMVARLWTIFHVCATFALGFAVWLATQARPVDWTDPIVKLFPFAVIVPIALLTPLAANYIAPRVSGSLWVYCFISCIAAWLAFLLSMAGFWVSLMTASEQPFVVGTLSGYVLLALQWPTRRRWRRWRSTFETTRCRHDVGADPALPNKRIEQTRTR